MRVLILEDEERAAAHLTALLRALEPDVSVVAVLDSVSEGFERWATLPTPALIFADIQLADGLSFSLFEQVTVPCPIIFTTAYDAYAIRAFRHNSIDYLLKPIDREALEISLAKYRTLTRQAADDQLRQLQLLLNERSLRPRNYRNHFLIPFRDKLVPVQVSDVAYFDIEGGVVSATLFSKNRYAIDQTLDELENQLDPVQFYRANRQFIVSRASIREAELYFNGRLQLHLQPHSGGLVLVSKDRAAQFKKWMEDF